MKPEQKTVTISLKKIVKWAIIIILILIAARLTWRVTHRSYYGLGVADSVGGDVASVSFDDGSAKLANPMSSGAFYGGNPLTEMFGNNNGSIADTRQFMKVNYSGDIKTRDVKDTARDVRGIIRDMEGRVDSETVTERYARVSFVIPKSNLDDFRDEIESLTHKKLYTENTSSENLLAQKQNIEERSDLTTKSLSDLQSEKSKAEAAHKKELAALQTQLNNLTTSVETMRTKLDTMPGVEEGSPEQVQAKMLQENYINTSNQITELKNKITQKTQTFTENKNNFNSAIAQFNNQLGEIKKDDKKFTENIETVNGSVSMQWVSIWQLAKVFSPVHPIIIIIILALILWYILKKMRIVPLVVVKW